MSADAFDSYESSRLFRMWRYSVSHSQLLLRSNPDDEHSTRIEVLFKAVDRIDLPITMHGLRVLRDGSTFLAYGTDWTGTVDATVMFVAEDARTYSDPSSFDLGPGSF